MLKALDKLGLRFESDRPGSIKIISSKLVTETRRFIGKSVHKQNEQIWDKRCLTER